MAEQRQPFRFRFPWSSAPAAPRRSQQNQASSSPADQAQPAAPPQQRRPFRPGGSAGSASLPTGQSPAMVEPPLVSESPTRSGRPSRASSRSTPQRQVGTPPKSPVASLPRDVSQTQSPSPSRGAIEQIKAIAPVTKPPSALRSAALELVQEVKSISTPKEQPTAIDMTERQKEKIEEDNLLPSSQKPLFMNTEKPPREKVVEMLKEKDKRIASGEAELKETEVSVLQSESKQGSRNEGFEVSPEQPMKILKGTDHEESEKKPGTHEKAQGSKAEIEGHPTIVLEEPGQHPREEVFDRKEILKTFGSNKHDMKSEHFDHKHASTGEKLCLKRDKHALNEKPFSIVTLTGENTGATMNMSYDSEKREWPIHINRGYKAKQDESVDTVIHSEGSSRSRKPAKIEEERGNMLCVNSNAQGINNSLVFNSSVTERNPGAHVAILHKAVESVKTGGEVEKHDTHKAEVSVIPAKRLTYAPNIRRRCLKGLFLESSDSDPENLEKPRSHGCRARGSS